MFWSTASYDINTCPVYSKENIRVSSVIKITKWCCVKIHDNNLVILHELVAYWVNWFQDLDACVCCLTWPVRPADIFPFFVCVFHRQSELITFRGAQFLLICNLFFFHEWIWFCVWVCVCVCVCVRGVWVCVCGGVCVWVCVCFHYVLNFHFGAIKFYLTSLHFTRAKC